jgi:hypothetical protein
MGRGGLLEYFFSEPDAATMDENDDNRLHQFTIPLFFSA